MGEHAYFAPSSASRWIPCPASLFLTEEAMKKETTSSYAHEGTVCHEIAAKCLTDHVSPSEYLGQIVEGVTLTQELVDGIQIYVDEIHGLAKEYKAVGGKIEHQVELTPDCWGTLDAGLWNTNTAIIADLKMGKGVIVPAEDNSQLKLYAVGLLKWLATEHKLTPTKVILYIIQPRTPDPIRRYALNRSELVTWFNESVVPVISTHSPGRRSDTKCNPGVVQCKWCPVSSTCAAQAHRMMNDAQQAFLPFTKAELPKEIVATGVELERELTLEEIVNLMVSFKHINQWMKGISQFVNDKALAGVKIPGFKLVEGRSNRIWKAEEPNVVTFLDSVKVEAYTKKLISPSQAEKAVGKKNPQYPNLAPMIFKPKGNPTLVPVSDKRPEMSLLNEEDVEESFEDFTVDDGGTLIVDSVEDSEEVGAMSALQRMKMADEEEETVKDEGTSESTKELTETATGGNPEEIFSTPASETQRPPKSNTQRYLVMQAALKGGTTIEQMAGVLKCTENMVKMHLRYLKERDGYGYNLYSDGTFLLTT